MKRLSRTLAAILLVTPLSALAANDCKFATTITIPAKIRKGELLEPAARAYQLNDGSIVFLGKFTVDADGAPRAYHPDGKSGLDLTANAGEPGNWYGIVAYSPTRKICTNTGERVVQIASDPAPGYFASPTKLVDETVRDCRRQSRYVDSSAITYVALPRAIAVIANNRGKLTVVHNIRNGRTGLGLQADAAPSHGRGEGSIRLAAELGYNSSPKRGGTSVRENLFIVTTETMGFPKSQTDVVDKARSAFDRWGGEARRKLCEAAVLAAPK